MPGIARRGIAPECQDGIPQCMVRLYGGRGESTSQPPTLPTRPREPRSWHPRLGDVLRTPLEDEIGSEQVATRQPLCASTPDRLACQRSSAQAYSSISRPYVSIRDARNAVSTTRCWPASGHGTASGVLMSRWLDTTITNDYAQCMETHEALRQRVRHEQKLKTRLHLAITRLDEAARERLHAIMAAHIAGWSIRKIAAITGLSRSRIHQLLQKEEARELSASRSPRVR